MVNLGIKFESHHLWWRQHPRKYEIEEKLFWNLKFKNNVSLNDFHQSSANILNLIVSLKIRILTFDLLITNTVTEIKEPKVKFGRKSQLDHSDVSDILISVSPILWLDKFDRLTIMLTESLCCRFFRSTTNFHPNNSKPTSIEVI